MVLFIATLTPCAFADENAEALAYQARGILRKHCQECHSQEQARAGLKILDHGELVTARSVVLPGTPDVSELLERIEEGSMPPGDRKKVSPQEQAVLKKWIESQAPFFPPEPSEESVFASIVQDVKTLKEEDKDLKSQPRYISLNHLLADTDPLPALEIYRKALSFAVGKLSPKKLPEGQKAITAIDRSATIFRISLRDLGWDIAIYDSAVKNKPDPLHFSIMDAILLAYPYGLVPAKSPQYSLLQREFLDSARQLRPIPFVRGDWLAGAMLQRPDKADFRVLPWYPDRNDPSMAAAAARYDMPVTLATFLAESSAHFAEERSGQEGTAIIEELSPLTKKGGTIDRKTWERFFHPMHQRLGIAQPLWTIDTLPRSDIAADSLAKEIRFFTYNVAQKKETDVLHPGDPFYVGVKNLSDRPLYVEVIWQSVAKDALVLDPKDGGPGEVVRLEPKAEIHFPEGGEGTEAGPDLGEDRFTILVSDSKFERGVRESLSDLLVPNRVVHLALPHAVRQKTIATMTSKP